MLELILTNDIDEINALVSEGFCPVECSIGGVSICDDLQMDHHGEMSHMEGVAIRAYRDHFGARSQDPRFVVCGAADADACFAIAAMAGIIPHPDRKVSGKLPPHIKASLTRDLSALAETVNRVDCSPIGLDIPGMEGGDILMTWNAMTASNRDSLGLQAGVNLWRSLLEGNPRQLAPFFGAAAKAESDRIAAAREDLRERGVVIDGVLVLRGSKTWGFDTWYARVESEAFEAVEGWEHPVVLAWVDRTSGVTIGCPNKAVAETIFGKGGLKNVFSRLQPEGWGGREAVGGSPRGVELTWEQVVAAAKVVADLIKS